MRISFCTTCMGRLFHLEQVFKRNLASASTFPDAEFVLLNYGSKDGLDSWVRDNLFCEIEKGRVSYYRTDDPKYWVASHAKNTAHRMAGGEVLCNLDSDIIIPEGFCEYVASLFESEPDIIMAFDSDDAQGNHGCAGIVAARREHFYSVNGYDESISRGWGCDDMNFQFRCRMHNSLRLFVPPKMCLCIPHSNEVRTNNCQLKQIEITRDMSISLCEKSAAERDYVANKGERWGSATVFKNFSDEPIAI
jgi:hypothetical protein